MRAGSFLGIPVILNGYFLWLLFAMAFWGQLPRAAWLFGSVTVHELFHAVMARRLGLRVRRIELLPFGGVARIDDLRFALDPSAEAKVAAAGPVANALLAGWAVIVAAALGSYSPSSLELPWKKALVAFASDNLTLMAFNLLPALPLDGGRILRAALAGRMGFMHSTRLLGLVGQAVGLGLTLAGLASLIAGRGGLSLALVGPFVYIAALQEQRRASELFVRSTASSYRAPMLQPDQAALAHALVATPQTPVLTLARRFLPRRYHLVFVVERDGRLGGVVTETQVLAALFESGPHTPVGALARRRP